MQKLIGLVGAAIICILFIGPASANNDNSVLVEMSHAEAAALINKEMDNWTDSDLGAWLVGHSYEVQKGHGFVSFMYGPVFVFSVAKSPSVLNENGFSCSQVIGSVYLPSDMNNQTNGIAIRICVKGDDVLVNIAAFLKRGESF